MAKKTDKNQKTKSELLVGTKLDMSIILRFRIASKPLYVS